MKKKKNRTLVPKFTISDIASQSIGLDFAWEKVARHFSVEYNWTEIIVVTKSAFSKVSLAPKSLFSSHLGFTYKNFSNACF